MAWMSPVYPIASRRASAHFPFEATVYETTMNTHVQVSCKYKFSFFVGKRLGSVRRGRCPRCCVLRPRDTWSLALAGTLSGQPLPAVLTGGGAGERWGVLVSVCSSRMTGDVGHLFTRWFPIHVSSSEKRLFTSLAHFWFVCFFRVVRRLRMPWIHAPIRCVASFLQVCLLSFCSREYLLKRSS